MPHSPFTRFLGLAIVAAYAVALLWPDPSVLIMGWSAMIALPVVILLFTWSAVKDAPVFDDRAFHRTLPPGDGHVFRRTLMVHGMVLAGIALSVIVYCWIFNFGWPAISFGVAALTVPVWAFMAASGIATSLSTSRQYGKSWGYIAIFVMPVFSAALLLSVHDYFDPEVYRRAYYFNSLREMAVAGATLYPLIWWLVAVKRRRVLGAVLGMATGALMPWIYIYGSFFEKSEEADPGGYQKSQVTLSRKPFVPGAGKWLAGEDLLHIDGLRAGEFIELWNFRVRERHLQAYEVPDGPAQADAAVTVANLLGALSGDGSVKWGRAAVWDCLRQQIPPHQTFGFWNRKLDIPTHLAVLRPGGLATVRPADEDLYFKPGLQRQELTDEDFRMGSWRVGSVVCRTEKMGVVSVEGGGTFRLAEGGILRVNPLHRDDVHYSISFQRYHQDLWQADGPWFKIPNEYGYWGPPWVIAVDESGKHAFALTPNQRVSSENVMLGITVEWTVNLGDAKTPEEIARMEMLRHCRLHVFWPRLVSSLEQRILPVK
jgi:hypothetical protein